MVIEQFITVDIAGAWWSYLAEMRVVPGWVHKLHVEGTVSVLGSLSNDDGNGNGNENVS